MSEKMKPLEINYSETMILDNVCKNIDMTVPIKNLFDDVICFVSKLE